MKKKTVWASLLLLGACLVAACGDNGETQARKHLQKAELALKEGKYNEAKLQIDSIRTLYPKAFEARKEGIGLMQQIDLAEQQRSLAYLDSTLAVQQQLVAEAKEGLVLEKDTAYQEVGNYFHPGQTVERTLYRSFLRGQVDEVGNMTLTSIYWGERHAHHHAVKVVAKDGTFAETPASEDIYESENVGWKTEKADYPLGKDGGVVAFIAMNHGVQTMKAHYVGERSYVINVRPEDSEAIVKLHKLSQVLTALEQTKREREEALRKIAFVERKMKENKIE
ncbi:MAG: hypothetical protein IJ013_04895 [Bacteroidaceae bacterium]|nr:hypothetical protein [Bacteroidaceae bacterium]